MMHVGVQVKTLYTSIHHLSHQCYDVIGVSSRYFLVISIITLDRIEMASFNIQGL